MGLPEALLFKWTEQEFKIDFDGQTVRDLVLHLFSENESEKGNVIFESPARISSQLQIIVNGGLISDSGRLDRRLGDGDFVELILAPG